MSIDPRLKELFLRYQKTFSDYDATVITDVNQRGSGEDTLLHLAASHCDCADVELLLQHGADVNAKGDIGLTALHHAAAKGKLDIVRTLIRYGADKNIRNEFDESAVDWAKNEKQDAVVKFLNSIID